MRPAYYAEKWQQLRATPDPHALESLAQRIASTFVDRYFYSDEYNREYIALLCEMATCFDEERLNQIAARALFGLVIERLCDDFEELQTETYNRLICQVVDFLRQLPAGNELDRELSNFQLQTEEQLYQRIESIRLSPDEKIPARLVPRKVLILSRITIGADVAITSVIVQRIAQAYPDAQIAILGNDKLSQVFTGNDRVSIHTLQYARRGGLLERFLVWLDLLRVVREELQGLLPDQYLVLDPDSRLTQLGVLPLVAAPNYRFFNSRGKTGYPVKASISELANLWLDNLLGHGAFCHPGVWPEAGLLSQLQHVRQRLDPHHHCRFITLNLGVGGNARKRVEGDFECRLVLALLQEPRNRVILDLGFGDEERRRSEAILEAARQTGIPTKELKFEELGGLAPEIRLAGVECSVGEISAIIANSDEFIGYDSACQHIAAALGIRTFTLFAGTNNARFIRRWRACGPNLSEIVYVDTVSRESQPDSGEIVERLMDLRSDSR